MRRTTADGVGRLMEQAVEEAQRLDPAQLLAQGYLASQVSVAYLAAVVDVLVARGVLTREELRAAAGRLADEGEVAPWAN